MKTGTCSRRWRSNPSGKCSQERQTRGTVTSTMRRAAHPSGRAMVKTVGNRVQGRRTGRRAATWFRGDSRRQGSGETDGDGRDQSRNSFKSGASTSAPLPGLRFTLHPPLLQCLVFSIWYFTEMCSGSEEGSYVRLIDFRLEGFGCTQGFAPASHAGSSQGSRSPWGIRVWG